MQSDRAVTSDGGMMSDDKPSGNLQIVGTLHKMVWFTIVCCHMMKCPQSMVSSSFLVQRGCRLCPVASVPVLLLA